jgi:two-component system, NarL family, response regulator DesR
MVAKINYEVLPLSPRQMEVLQAAAEGETVEETATRLFLVTNTIKYHREWARSKLSAKSMAHAVHEAHLQGLLS